MAGTAPRRNPERSGLILKSTLPLSEVDKTFVCMAALADLFERDAAELQRTKQPGSAAMCRELKTAVRELRQPRRAAANP